MLWIRAKFPYIDATSNGRLDEAVAFCMYEFKVTPVTNILNLTAEGVLWLILLYLSEVIF
jgi:hypothetical protein